MRLREYLGFEKPTADRWLRNLLINLLPDFWIVNRFVRPLIARLCGMHCGPGVILQKGIFYGNPRNVHIGNKSAVARGAFLDGYDKITIGDSVGIAYNVTLITSNHEMGNAEKRAGKLFGGPIVIGDGTWIAAQVTIGPGTEIGSGSMISPGTTVMRSVPSNSLVAGSPGKVVTRLVDSPAAPIIAPSMPPMDSRSQRDPETSVADKGGRTDVPIAAASDGLKSASDGLMTRAEFYAELEILLELDRGALSGDELLADMSNWDSMAKLAFIAMTDSKLHIIVSPPALEACSTISELMNLFPGKITKLQEHGEPKNDN